MVEPDFSPASTWETGFARAFWEVAWGTELLLWLLKGRDRALGGFVFPSLVIFSLAQKQQVRRLYTSLLLLLISAGFVCQ